MRTSHAAAAIVVISLLAGCGGDVDDARSAPSEPSEPAATSDTATTTTVTAPTPSSSQPTSTTSTTTTSTSTSTTTTPPTTTPRDCLDGTWWLSPAETTALYAALLPGIPVTITGTHWAEFSAGSVDYWAVLEARFTAGGTDVTFGIDQHGVGTYTVADDVLTMTYDTFESTIHEGHGSAITNPDQHPETYVDEALDIADNGNGTITINRVTVPVIDIPPVAGGPMGCDDDTMSLGFTSGLADAAGVYVRLS